MLNFVELTHVTLKTLNYMHHDKQDAHTFSGLTHCTLILHAVSIARGPLYGL